MKNAAAAFLLVIVAVLGASAFAGPVRSGGGSSGTATVRVDGSHARALVATGATLVDVRTPEEFAEGHIAGARNVPVSELASRLAELPRNVPVVVYCRSGGRSASAASQLAAAGFRVSDLGPMSAW